MHGVHAFTIVVALAARRNQLRELDKCDNARGKRAAKRKRTRAVYRREGYSMMTDLFSMRTAYREFLQADIWILYAYIVAVSFLEWLDC